MNGGVTGEKIKIAVFVSGGGTNLQAIIDAEKSGILRDGKLALVLSDNPSAYALTRATKAGIKAVVVEKKASQTEFEEQISDVLEENDIELIVLAGFLRILRKDFVERYKDRIINVHPSLIPSFCGKGFYGLKVHERALAYGVKVTGATVHFVNEIPDGGQIIMQKAVPVKSGDTPETLQKRVMVEAEHKLLPRAVQSVCKNLRKTAKKQTKN
ncbi:MAG: phosphoribosylglycinamide formyltransferase [Eubacteriales bacterium]|nr:phosphoribosylglycinamide formyltransferase [Eubacteriales bacterium]